MSGDLGTRTWHRWAEPAAVLLNLVYTVGYMRGWPGCFLAAGIGSTLFVAICAQRRLLAEAGLWLFYIGFAMYGWWNVGADWPAELPVATAAAHALSIALAGVAWWGLAAFLRRQKADLPAWDALTTVGSLLATYWMVQLVQANWLYWIVIDAAAIGLYVRKQLRWGAALMFIYTLLAIEGYFDFFAWL
jgi:nicotinamide mononucleotide transporter